MSKRETNSLHLMTHWARVVSERMESGLSVSAYCEKTGLKKGRYYYWEKKLRDTASEAQDVSRGDASPNLSTPIFAEVRLSEPQALPRATDLITGSQIIVEAAGLRIAASSDYPVSSLVELLQKVLQPC